MKVFLSALKKHRFQLLDLPGVISVGVGFKHTNRFNTGRMSLVVGVEKKVPRVMLARSQAIPGFLDSLPTDVVEIGRVVFQGFSIPGINSPPSGGNNAELRKSKLRPAPPGVSIGHYKTSAGTLGAVVRGRFPGGVAILSNNHILANGTDGRDGLASVGDPILQPGPYDGGTDRDIIARLASYSPYKWISTQEYKQGKKPEPNLMDAALAIPMEPGLVDGKIMGLGPVNGTTEPFPGMPVFKSGRSTGITSSQITAIHNTLHIEDDKRSYLFEDQIATGSMSDNGDSGSLILAADGRAVGLLFAGSDRITYASPISRVLGAFNAKL
ncbi:hypothetical protein DCCM_2236 [Desulfocucumis palustris]|uniref:Peptidase S1 domain-containing protein n=1 Tax=Desulfocucumis palustris TaxID=1898651 RepID=A0A2L2XA37_9FIRM|nr:hypothetical protein [Desulfocucumis palustris]GBF33139.1 hypothetical protein DCCM_2236 [Desulfocucumis palustris]